MTRLGSSSVETENANCKNNINNFGNVPEKCVNCDQKLSFANNDNENSRMVGAGVVAFTSVVKNMKTQVVIGDALKEIYSILNIIINLDEESGGKNCALCVDCCLIFAQLYGLLQAFEARRKTDRFLQVSLTNAMRMTSSDRSKRDEVESSGDVQVDVATESENFAAGLGNTLEGPCDTAENHDCTSSNGMTVESVPTTEQLPTDDLHLSINLDQAMKIEPHFDDDDPLHILSPPDPAPSFVDTDEEVSEYSAPKIPKIISVQTKGHRVTNFPVKSATPLRKAFGDTSHINAGPSSSAVAVQELSAQALAASNRKSLPAGSFYPCDKCGMNFTRKGNMLRHVARFHDKKQPEYTCSHCPRRFYRKESLAVHLKRVAASQNRSAATSGVDSTEEMHS